MSVEDTDKYNNGTGQLGVLREKEQTLIADNARWISVLEDLPLPDEQVIGWDGDQADRDAQ